MLTNVSYLCLTKQIYKQTNQYKSPKSTKMKIAERIPGGLIGNGTETFAVEGQPFTIYQGRLHSFAETPKCRIDIYTDNMKANPKGEKAMEEMTGSACDTVKVKQWMMCRFGGIDNTPDINDYGLIQEAEYVPCAKRGSCPFEGIGCCTVEVHNGVYLSRAEMSVIRLINLPDKLIADQLHLSTETIKSHIQNIRKKIDAPSKIEVAIWAVLKGII